jgi:hypothetical protein
MPPPLPFFGTTAAAPFGIAAKSFLIAVLLQP